MSVRPLCWPQPERQSSGSRPVSTAGSAALNPAGDLSAHLAMADPRFALPAPGQPSTIGNPFLTPSDPPQEGRVVAVWGPAGAPGRTMLATNLAVEVSATGVPDAPGRRGSYGGVLASAFGLLDESPGLAGACRQAANGRLDLAALTGLVWAVGPDLRLLTGISRADRWPEVRPSAIPAVLGVGQVDGADHRHRLRILPRGGRGDHVRYCSATPKWRHPDDPGRGRRVVVAVGSADPPGMERVIRGLPSCGNGAGGETAGGAEQVAPDRCTAGGSGGRVGQIRRSGGDGHPARGQSRSMDKSWQLGVPLAEAVPGSPLRKAVRDLASSLLSVPVPR